jgi:hypothetical protein
MGVAFIVLVLWTVITLTGVTASRCILVRRALLVWALDFILRSLDI